MSQSDGGKGKISKKIVVFVTFHSYTQDIVELVSFASKIFFFLQISFGVLFKSNRTWYRQPIYMKYNFLIEKILFNRFL